MVSSIYGVFHTCWFKFGFYSSESFYVNWVWLSFVTLFIDLIWLMTTNDSITVCLILKHFLHYYRDHITLLFQNFIKFYAYIRGKIVTLCQKRFDIIYSTKKKSYFIIERLPAGNSVKSDKKWHIWVFIIISFGALKSWRKSWLATFPHIGF